MRRTTLSSLCCLLLCAAGCGAAHTEEDAGLRDAGGDGDAGRDAGPRSPLLQVFFTAPVAVGGGVAGFDTACNTSDRRPYPDVEYAALVMSDTRRACTSANCSDGPDALDWPLVADGEYGELDALVFRTDANAIVTEAPARRLSPVGDEFNFWSGATGDWTPAPANQCSNWTSRSASAEAAVGWTGEPIDEHFQGGHGLIPCDMRVRLLCVELP